MVRIISNLRRYAALGALLAACCLLPSALSQPGPDIPDAKSIKVIREVVTPDRIGAAKERLGLSALEHLSLADFDERERRALHPIAPPKLVEAHYFRAELSGDALIGKGEWTISYDGAAAAVLPLNPLNIAVRQPRFTNQEAVLGEFDSIGTGLLVEGKGLHTVTFDWSAHQESATDGLKFVLDLPPCGVAWLELDLPPEWIVSADDLPVSEMEPGANPPLKSWRVTCSRRNKGLTLVLRRPVSERPPVVLAGHLTTQQTLTSNSVAADFTFDQVKVLSGEVRELTCELDPSLLPIEVTAPDLKEWSVKQPAAPGAPATLAIQLNRPLLLGTLTVRCVAPLPLSGRWTAPGLRLRGAVPGSESLSVQVDADVALESWDSGGFRLVESQGDEKLQSLRLVGGLAPPRPSAEVRTGRPDFRARQLALWKVDPHQPVYTAYITYEVRRGHLSTLRLQLPAGYTEVERLDTEPAGAASYWRPRIEGGKPMLLVNLAPLLGPERTLRLKVVLRPPVPPQGLSWPIPDLIPLDAQRREGGLAIDFDEQRFEGHLSAPGLTADPPREEGPWEKIVPKYYGSYRDKPLSGALDLRPVAPRVRVHTRSNVTLTRGGAAVETTLQLQAEAGRTQTLDVYVSAPLPQSWRWTTAAGSSNEVSFERLPAREPAMCIGCDAINLLAACDPLWAAALLVSWPRGEWYRLKLRQPLEPREPLTLQAAADLVRGADGRWQVPLPAVAGAEANDGEVAVYLTGADLMRIDTRGLREAQPAIAARESRLFHYGAPPVELALSGPAAGADRAVLTTKVEPDGRMLHLFRFQVWGWRDPALPLWLPAGARLLSLQVNGLWIERVPQGKSEEGALRFDLPAPERHGPAESVLRRYKVVYETDRPSGWPLLRLEAPAPRLPLAPLILLRRWRLPPGMVPLHDGTVRALPSAAAEPDDRAEGQDLSSLSSLLLHPWTLSEGDERQRQQLTAAARGVRAPAGRPLTLGEALERVACDLSAEPDHPLIVDSLALAEANLAPGRVLDMPADPTKDAAPFWESLDLVIVASRPAPLLTTRRRRDSWPTAGGETIPPSVEAAIAEAAANGHDTSGRFLWALDWARRGVGAPHPAGQATLFDAIPPGWTEWEPVAGSDADSRLIVVRSESMQATGLALAPVLLVLLWLVRRRAPGTRLLLLLGWLDLAGGGLLWLPASLHDLALLPLLAGTVVGVAWYVWLLTRPATPSAPSLARPRAVGVAAACLLVLLGAGSALFGEAGGPPAPRPTVLVVPGPPDAPERTEVLAPRQLLKQLDARANPSAPHGAVITDATYTGTVVGDAVDFEAVLHIRNFEDGPATLALPFTNVRLKEPALLHGALADLVAPAGQDWRLTVPKSDKPEERGELVLKYRVSLKTNNSERELQFRVPKVPQSHLMLTVPAGSAYFEALVRQGSLMAEKAADGRTSYAVELGRTDGPLLFRWHEETAGHPEAVLRVREAYLWNLRLRERADVASLTAVLHYTVSKGAPLSLALDLPDNLQVQDVVARSAEAGWPAPALKSWYVEAGDRKLLGPAHLVGQALAAQGFAPVGGPAGAAAQQLIAVGIMEKAEKGQWTVRRLRLDFAAPVTRGVYVVVRLLPQQPLGQLATLTVPNAVGEALLAARVRVDSAGCFLTYQTDGVEAEIKNTARVRAPLADPEGAAERKQFADLWSAAGESSVPALRAPHALPRGTREESFLQFALQAAPAAIRGSQDVAWTVGPNQTDLRAVAHLTTSDSGIRLVEWLVPDDVVVTRVAAVAGSNPVLHWSHHNNRVQVWLTAASTADLELHGWKGLTPDKGGERFDMPGVRLLSPHVEMKSVRVLAAPDVSLTAEQLAGLGTANPELNYSHPQPGYHGLFHVRRLGTGGEARILTTARIAGEQLAFTSHIEYRGAGGREVQVRLRHWRGATRLDIPAGARRRSESRPGEGEHSWAIELPPGTASVMLTLEGTMALPAAGLTFPEVTTTGTARLDRWLAVAGRGLATDGSKQLTKQHATPELPTGLRPRLDQLLADGGSLWKIDGADGSLRLLPQGRSGAAPVRVVLTERASAVVDGRHWVHEASVWLYHEGGQDFRVVLPEGAHLLAAAVDGQTVSPFAEPTERLWIHLPSAAGARSVRLRWAFAPELEPLDRPRLQRPTWLGADDGPVVWTVHVPAGYASHFDAGAEGGPKTLSSPAGLDLARAEAQYRLSAALAEEPGPTPALALALTQRRFYQFCRYAQAGRLLTASQTASNLRGQGFDNWLQELRKMNSDLARANNFEDVRARAEREADDAPPLTLEPAAPGELPDLAGVGLLQTVDPRGDSLPERGTPLRWLSASNAAAPPLLLTPLAEQQTHRAAVASLLLALLLVLIWALAHFPGALGWVRTFWPEQAALLGFLGWQTYGPTLPLLALIVLGVAARLLFLGLRLLSALHRPPVEAARKGSTGPGMSME